MVATERPSSPALPIGITLGASDHTSVTHKLWEPRSRKLVTLPSGCHKLRKPCRRNGKPAALDQHDPKRAAETTQGPGGHGRLGMSLAWGGSASAAWPSNEREPSKQPEWEEIMSFAATNPASTARHADTLPAPVIPYDQAKPVSDDALVSRTRAGDLDAFAELLSRHEQNLLRLAFRFVRNEHDAQEVLQDVFVTTWRKLPGFQDRAQIGSWLYRVTVNASLMHLRVRKRRPECVNMTPGERQTKLDLGQNLDLDASDRHRPDTQLESQELRRVIQDAIDRLPTALRAVFDVREIQGWSTRQAAKMLGVSEATVKTRLHRARRLLRARVEGYLVQ